MANLKVALLLRVKTPNQERPYLKPALAANGKIRPLWAVYNNQPTHFPHGIYYLRHKQGKRLVFEQVGADLAVAQIQLLRRRNLLEAKALGNAVEEAEAPISHVRLDSAIDLYLDEIAARRSLRTAKCYRYVLELFRMRCQREYLDELSRADMVAFIAKQKEQGLSNRTICNQVANLDTFFRANGLPKFLANADRPDYTEKLVKAYSQEELSRLQRTLGRSSLFPRLRRAFSIQILAKWLSLRLRQSHPPA